MDIASFKEIRCIHQLENEEFKATTKSLCNRAAMEEWNGFWSRVATIEKKKKKKAVDCDLVKREKASEG